MTASIGHNSVAGDQLKAIVERLEKLDEEKSAIGDDIKDLYAEAKSNGFDVAAIRAVFARRKRIRKNKDKVAEHESLVDTYTHAIGDLLE